MSSMVLWRDAETRVTASWHKGNTFDVTITTAPPPPPAIPIVHTIYCRRYASNAGAIRAARRLADRIRRKSR